MEARPPEALSFLGSPALDTAAALEAHDDMSVSVIIRCTDAGVRHH